MHRASYFRTQNYQRKLQVYMKKSIPPVVLVKWYSLNIDTFGSINNKITPRSVPNSHLALNLGEIRVVMS